MTDLSEFTNGDGCGVTILRTVKQHRATKRWRWDDARQAWVLTSYEAGARFAPEERQAADLGELVAVLQEVRRDPSAFVVRGALKPAVRDRMAAQPAHLIRRLKHAKGEASATLDETPRRWVMLDIDKWPLQAWADLVTDPDAVIAHMVEHALPDAFQGVEFWWQLSSSAGFKPGVVSAHVWFWLTKPVSNAHIKAVLKEHAPGVDGAPFNAAQPHFVADPMVEGRADPLPRRAGWHRRPGLDAAVVLPDLTPAPPRPARPMTATRGAGRGAGLQEAMAAALAGMGRNLGGDVSRSGFHEPLRTATMLYARHVTSRGAPRDDEALKEWLRDLIEAAPRNTDDGPTYAPDTYLDRLIGGAFERATGRDEWQGIAPHHAAPTSGIAAAQAECEEQTASFYGRALEWLRLGDTERDATPAEHGGLILDVGVGKSTTAARGLPEFMRQAKASAEDGGARRWRVEWLVPTHKLGNEALQGFGRLGVRAAVWRGRKADEPGTGFTMCRNLDAVEDARKAGQKAEVAACGSGKPGEPSCIFRASCAYQKQKAECAAADVLIASHDALFNPLPQEVTAGFALTVVDEAFWQSGLQPNRDLLLPGFAEEPTMWPVLYRDVEGRVAGADLEATNDLHSLSARVERAFAGMEPGDLLARASVEAAGLTASDCRAAVILEWRRKQEGRIVPGMSPEDRRAEVERVAGAASFARRAGVWAALADLLEGSETHSSLQRGATKTGEPAILLHTRKEVRPGAMLRPLLHLDGTMPRRVVRRFLPRLDVLADVRVATPHMTVEQVTGGWGKTSLCDSPKQDAQENERRSGKVAEVADFVRLRAGASALVVTYEAIEQRFALPRVQTAHFNAVAGLDAFGQVEALFVIGRPMPKPEELRALALALTGRPIPAEASAKQTRGVLMADGSGSPMEVRAYDDPDLEALREAITEAAIVQAIGRGRGVNRTAANPLRVYLLADVVVPLPIACLSRWQDVKPDVCERMRARGGRVLDGSPTDAWRAYPDLFPTPEAARKALARIGQDQADKSLREGRTPFLGECPLVPVTYRPVGPKLKSRTMGVTLAGLAGLREWLVEVCGAELAYFEVAGLPDTLETRALTMPERNLVPIPPARSIDCDDAPTIDSDDDTILPDSQPAPIFGELCCMKANAKGGGIVEQYGGD